jgi:hypothetical protein
MSRKWMRDLDWLTILVYATAVSFSVVVWGLVLWLVWYLLP